ncbi:MAG: ribonuclease HI family protein [Deltaproteobacteria bacterium]|nr:ribonuclease HI family protein [Deltaproteobacteria bacterium]MCL5276293.1 ribonuclease HI family protein [Deltaproteobacteria bacterium]
MNEITVFIDGASRGNPGEAGCGVVIHGVKDGPIHLTKYIGHATNNAAEYSALILALEKLKELGIKKLKLKSDSQLLVYQLNGRYAVKSPGIRKLFRVYMSLAVHFESIAVEHIPRELNREADMLANLAIDQKS